MSENDLIKEEMEIRHKQDYYESLEEKDYVELEICKGNDGMCMEYAEDDDTHLCKECQRLMQKCFAEWINDFNKEEREYIIEYVKGMEV